MLKKVVNLFLKVTSLIDNISNSKKNIRVWINLLFLVVLILSVLFLVAILFSLGKANNYYVPFALFTSMTIATLTLKASMRDKVIEHHFEVTSNVKTQLHLLVSNINILIDLLEYITKLYNGESGSTKHLLINTKKLFEKMIDNLYLKENIVLFEPKTVTIIESIMKDSIFIQAIMDRTVEQYEKNQKPLLKNGKYDSEIENICSRLSRDLKVAQEMMKDVIKTKSESYTQLVLEENG